jgi:hypothetical protein
VHKSPSFVFILSYIFWDIQRRVARCKSTDVSEEYVASGFKVENKRSKKPEWKYVFPGVISQKIGLFIATAVRISNPNKMHPVYILTPYFMKIQFSILFPYRPLIFFKESFVCFCHLSCVCYMFCYLIYFFIFMAVAIQCFQFISSPLSSSLQFLFTSTFALLGPSILPKTLFHNCQ